VHWALQRLCRARDGVVDVVTTGTADNQGHAPHGGHEVCPRGQASPNLPSRAPRRGDDHHGALLAYLPAPPHPESVDSSFRTATGKIKLLPYGGTATRRPPIRGMSGSIP